MNYGVRLTLFKDRIICPTLLGHNTFFSTLRVVVCRSVHQINKMVTRVILIFGKIPPKKVKYKFSVEVYDKFSDSIHCNCQILLI